MGETIDQIAIIQISNEKTEKEGALIRSIAGSSFETTAGYLRQP